MIVVGLTGSAAALAVARENLAANPLDPGRIELVQADVFAHLRSLRDRGARFGQDPDYVKQANNEIMLLLQFETKAAIDLADEILEVPGIDVAFLGPNDLSADMGHVGNWDHPDVQKAIKKLEDAANKRKIPLGTISRNWEAAKACIERGYRFQSLLGDIPFLMQAAKAAVTSFRQHPHVAKG